MTHIDDEDERGEAERYNDDHIAPKLAALCKEAREHGLDFVAHVGWRDPTGTNGENGQTTAQGDVKASAAFAVCYAAARAGGNLDAMLMTLMRWHDEGETDISRTMLGHWMKRNAPAEHFSKQEVDEVPK